jgi:hypothetical protein
VAAAIDRYIIALLNWRHELECREQPMSLRLGKPIVAIVTLVTIVPLMAAIGGCAAPPHAAPNPTVVQLNVSYGPQGDAYKKLERGAIAGTPQRIGFYYSINPDCSLNGLVRIQVKDPPAHGSVAFDNADGYTSFPSGSAGFECNRKKSPGTEVMYTANRDFVGTDKLTIQVLGPNGRYMETEYTVKVLAPK